MVKAADDYSGLVPRKTSIAACVFVMLELLTAIVVVICAFVLFGGFCENLSCDEISKGLGLWLGFPLMIPSLLGVVVLGTRHLQALATFGITNLLVLIIAFAHTVLVYNDNQDYWKKWVDAYNEGTKCSVVVPSQCACTVEGFTKTVPYACELIEFGSDVNWVLFGFSIVSIVLSLCGVIIFLVGYNQIPSKNNKN